MSEKITFTPISYTGWDALSHLLAEVERFKVKKILIVTDPFLKDIGLTNQVSEPLESAGYTVDIYTEVVPEPL